MNPEYDYWTGHLSTVEPSLNRSIRAYLNYGYKVKIGITNDPNRRANEHSKNIGWERMVVKYKTNSNYYINNMERILIDNHWIYIENEVRGGGGRNAIVGPYYLYVLLG